MAMVKLELIGEDLWFEGYHVAMLTNNVPATVMGELRDTLNEGIYVKDPSDENKEVPDGTFNDGVSAARKRANELAKGGLIRMAELDKELADLDEFS